MVGRLGGGGRAVQNRVTTRYPATWPLLQQGSTSPGAPYPVVLEWVNRHGQGAREEGSLWVFVSFRSAAQLQHSARVL